MRSTLIFAENFMGNKLLVHSKKKQDYSKTILTQSYLIPWIMVLKLVHHILSPVAKIEVGNIFANYQVVGFKSFMGSTSSLFG